MFEGIYPAGRLSVVLPECKESVDVEMGYLPLRIVPLSKEARRRYWNKTVVEAEGELTLAELVILRLAEERGFDAVWVTGAGRFTKVWPPLPEVVPPVAGYWYERIASSAEALAERAFGRRSKGGCWDILGCREDEVLFVESKRKGKDAINDYQRGWLEAALQEGVPLSSFFVVEWG